MALISFLDINFIKNVKELHVININTLSLFSYETYILICVSESRQDYSEMKPSCCEKRNCLT